MKKKFLSTMLIASMLMANTTVGFAGSDGTTEKEDSFISLRTVSSVDVSSNKTNDQHPYTFTSVSEETGFSISFTLDTAVTGDWDTVLSSYDFTIQQPLTLINYTTDGWTSRVNVYEGDATTSEAAETIKAEKNIGNWQLFLNTTDPITVSFDSDGSVKWYLNHQLMLTYPATLTCGTGTVADYVKMVTDAVSKDGIMFTVAASNVSFGYGVSYKGDVQTVSAEAKYYVQTKQTSKATNGSEAKYSVRIIADVQGIDLKDYKDIGFKFTNGDNEESALTDTVYTTLVSKGENVTADGYYVVIEVTDVPASGEFSVQLIGTPTDESSAVVIGTTGTVDFSMANYK
jgi:hypothetical protein